MDPDDIFITAEMRASSARFTRIVGESIIAHRQLGLDDAAIFQVLGISRKPIDITASNFFELETIAATNWRLLCFLLATMPAGE